MVFGFVLGKAKFHFVAHFVWRVASDDGKDRVVKEFLNLGLFVLELFFVGESLEGAAAAGANVRAARRYAIGAGFFDGEEFGFFAIEFLQLDVIARQRAKDFKCFVCTPSTFC